MALFGDQAQHVYVRVLVACEIIANRDAYSEQSKACVIRNVSVILSPYTKILQDVLTDGGYAELVHLYAVSTAFHTSFHSYMPSSTIAADYNPYTSVITGRGVHPTTSATFSVMWTMTTVPKDAASFSPNHIVYLAERSLLQENDVVQLQSDDGTDIGTEDYEYSDDNMQLDSADSDYSDIEPSSTADDSVEFTPAAAKGMRSLPGCQFLSTRDVVELIRRPQPGMHVQHLSTNINLICTCCTMIKMLCKRAMIICSEILLHRSTMLK